MNNPKQFLSLDYQAQQLVKLIVKQGERVIDATAGNGHDTLFLAKLVGISGIVYAFDIQKQALQNTLQKLSTEACTQQVQLINTCHAQAKEHVRNQTSENIAAIMFNLGFLPGSDKGICTESISTLHACETLLPLLRLGGIMTIHTYTGIFNAKNESQLIIEWAKDLQWKKWHVSLCSQLNKIKNTEHLILIHRLH